MTFLSFFAALAALLDDLLELLRRVLRRLLAAGRLVGLLLLLLLLRLLDVLLVQLHLLQRVGLRLHGRNAGDLLQGREERRLRGERRLLPRLEGLLRELRDHLKVVASA